MGEIQYKILVLSVLYSLCFPAQCFCSPEPKKSVTENHRIRYEIRMVDSLNYLAVKVADSNIRLSQEYATKALTLAKSIHYLKGQGEALLHLGQYYFYANNFLQSLELNYKALEVAKQSKDIKLKTTALKQICAIFIKLRRSDKAKSYFGKSFNLAMNNKDTANIIELLFHLGQIYELDNASEKSKAAFLQGIMVLQHDKRSKKNSLDQQAYWKLLFINNGFKYCIILL